jgi:hypothetical protein
MPPPVRCFPLASTMMGSLSLILFPVKMKRSHMACVHQHNRTCAVLSQEEGISKGRSYQNVTLKLAFIRLHKQLKL